jgi:hypothetical protein
MDFIPGGLGPLPCWRVLGLELGVEGVGSHLRVDRRFTDSAAHS